jgi:hypothetical protein
MRSLCRWLSILQELGRKEYLRQQIMTAVALLDRDPLILGEALIEVLQLLEEEVRAC